MTAADPNEKRALVTGRTYTMRELLTAARERFGAEASRYKTREELMVALGYTTPPEANHPVDREASSPALVVKDFFLPPGR